MRESKYDSFFRINVQAQSAECLACGKEIKCSRRNTSGKMRHLQRIHPELFAIAMEEKEDYTVERVLSVHIVRQMVLVTVKWLGWPLQDATYA